MSPALQKLVDAYQAYTGDTGDDRTMLQARRGYTHHTTHHTHTRPPQHQDGEVWPSGAHAPQDG